MTNPVIEAMALAMINSDRMAGGWPKVASRDTIPDSHGYVRCAIVALKALEENITDEMLDAARNAPRSPHTSPDLLTAEDIESTIRFTAMLKAARRE